LIAAPLMTTIVGISSLFSSFHQNILLIYFFRLDGIVDIFHGCEVACFERVIKT
jgi:hypothetical protein